MTSGIILAGGESRRIGSPKALLKIGKDTFADRISNVMKNAGVETILLVAGAHHNEIEKHSGKYSVISNPDFALGQFSSLQQGIRHLPDNTSLVLVWPVDLPLVQLNTVQVLLDVAQQQNNPITLPVHSNKRGHPVIYNAEVLKRILSMQPTDTAKQLLDFFAGRISLVNVQDPAVLIDIDTSEDYDRHITRGDFSL
jgi:molybdenum cofactor cytidylyltransferase